MDGGPRVRVLVVDPDPGRRDVLVRLLAEVPVDAVAHLQEVGELVRAKPPNVIMVASELAGQAVPGSNPWLPIDPPQSVVKVVIARAGEGLATAYLASGFHAVLYDPLTRVEIDRVLRLAEEILRRTSDAERRRARRAEALRQLEVEILTLADLTSNWLTRALEFVRRLLDLPALALWELVETTDQLRCLGAIGLPEQYLVEAERSSVGRARAIVDALLESPLQPIELHPESADPRLITPPEARQELGLRQAVAVPYREAGRLRGFISFYFSEQEPFDKEELPVYDAVAGILATALAISRARRQLVASQRMLSELVAGLQVGVIVSGMDGTVRLANHAAARMLGVTHAQLVGASLPTMFRARSELPWDSWRQLAPGMVAETVIVQVSSIDRRFRELECRVQAIELPDAAGEQWHPCLQFLLEDVTLERRRLLELELLQDLTRMVTDHRDLDAAFRMVAERLQQDFGFALVGLAVLSQDRQRFIGQTIRAPGEVSFNEWLTSRGVTGRALRENRSQLVLDVRADPDYFAPLPGFAAESEIVVLLRRWGEPIGVLNIESAPGHRLDEEDLRLAENVAVHLELLMEQVELTDRLSRQALTDPLTGLANRRALVDRLQQVTRDRRVHRAVVLLIDFDGFKRLNDERGHLFGDAVLQQVADRLARLIRPDDLLARYAGDEFAVVLAEIDLGEAVEVAERLRRAVAREPFVHEGTAVSLTISIGIAAYPDDGATPDELIRAADDAMYRAKRQGGNRVALARDNPSPEPRDEALGG